MLYTSSLTELGFDRAKLIAIWALKGLRQLVRRLTPLILLLACFFSIRLSRGIALVSRIEVWDQAKVERFYIKYEEARLRL